MSGNHYEPAAPFTRFWGSAKSARRCANLTKEGCKGTRCTQKASRSRRQGDVPPSRTLTAAQRRSPQRSNRENITFPFLMVQGACCCSSPGDLRVGGVRTALERRRMWQTALSEISRMGPNRSGCVARPPRWQVRGRAGYPPLTAAEKERVSFAQIGSHIFRRLVSSARRTKFGLKPAPESPQACASSAIT